ncbi:MAG: xylose isomerase protein [Capsulimonas sp.]|jgi:sugar phosphate isomerase/epimerase|nr:xylose isomerase protein [Capsulimonas sp.]
MKLQVYKALWGMEGSLDEQLDQIAEAGYDGVEAPIPDGDLTAFERQLKSRGLGFIGMLFPGDVAALDSGVARASELDVKFLNVHSAADHMPFDLGCDFFEGALLAEGRSGIKITHETHRGRLLFNPWTTAAYLRKFPELKIAADFSHWTCVCERLLDENDANMKIAYERSHHVHGRVGHEQGPQVSDPRAPEFAYAVTRFETYWDRIRAAHKARGEDTIYFTPEYGPPTYMPVLPYTQEPVGDLWEICLYSANRVRERWGA